MNAFFDSRVIRYNFCPEYFISLLALFTRSKRISKKSLDCIYSTLIPTRSSSKICHFPINYTTFYIIQSIYPQWPIYFRKFFAQVRKLAENRPLWGRPLWVHPLYKHKVNTNYRIMLKLLLTVDFFQTSRILKTDHNNHYFCTI